MNETDEQLYSRFLTHHGEDDLRVLLERHRESLTLFLYGFVNDMGDAEELMLDAYAHVAVGSALFSGKRSFKTWLFAVCKKLALAHLRRSRRTPQQLDESMEAETAPMELSIMQDERNRQLYQALAQIKPEYRQTLTLLYFEQMSHEEAARVMGKTKRQTYHLAERGRAALREKLGQMGFDGAPA